VGPGDQLPQFMEKSIRENDFVLIICTATYKYKSDNRVGGVGFEGNIITAEAFSYNNQRKFIPILRRDTWRAAAPTWLLGKYYIDLRGTPFSEEQYNLLLKALYGISSIRPISSIGDTLHFDWVLIPEGAFIMGSDPNDAMAFSIEFPQHRVILKDYNIARIPITNAQYKIYTQQAGVHCPSHWKRDQIPLNKEYHPVTNISWYEAQSFCKFYNVRLPSEAEWEKAARGIDGRLYPWGNDSPDKRLCNFDQNVGGTTPVNEYLKGVSPYGVIDMVGNVWEWTSTNWGRKSDVSEFAYPYNELDGREDINADDTVYRILRGGAYDRYKEYIRATYRRFLLPNSKKNILGFRVVQDITP
jgi:serine/threonine-protein kinase